MKDCTLFHGSACGLFTPSPSLLSQLPIQHTGQKHILIAIQVETDNAPMVSRFRSLLQILCKKKGDFPSKLPNSLSRRINCGRIARGLGLEPRCGGTPRPLLS